MKRDLGKRLFRFSRDMIELCNKTKITITSKPIINQLIRSATSIGANYAEANNAISKKEFRHKICICKKEAQETKYWLELLIVCCGDGGDKINLLSKECCEFVMIFQRIVNSLNK